MQIAIETIGWTGSALILVSVAQSRPRRLHLLNIGACITLTVYNAFIGAVPGIGLNAGLILVNLWRLRSLHLQSAAPVSVDPEDEPSLLKTSN